MYWQRWYMGQRYCTKSYTSGIQVRISGLLSQHGPAHPHWIFLTVTHYCRLLLMSKQYNTQYSLTFNAFTLFCCSFFYLLNSNSNLHFSVRMSEYVWLVKIGPIFTLVNKGWNNQEIAYQWTILVPKLSLVWPFLYYYFYSFVNFAIVTGITEQYSNCSVLYQKDRDCETSSNQWKTAPIGSYSKQLFNLSL